MTWSAEEDEFLMKHAPRLSFNWTLVGEFMQSQKAGTIYRRSAIDYHLRYKSLSESGRAGIPQTAVWQEPTPIFAPEFTKRLNEKLSVFDFILRRAKQRPDRSNRSK
jgi:hypothetical protein